VTMQQFNDKVAFITGGGTGIGAAMARKFAAAGGRVVLMGRRREPLEAVAGPLGGLVVTGDAADTREVRQAIVQAKAAYGRIDVLVANAGGHGVGSALATDERQGNIVILSSLAGHFAGPAVVGYVTMKHALIGLTRSLARDYGRAGVRVNAVCPGWVRTAMADQQMDALRERQGLASIEEAYRLVTRDVPLGRAAEPEEVADAIMFLASPQASMISGTSLMVDGASSTVDLPTIAFTSHD